jgi:hypothetical protein
MSELSNPLFENERDFLERQKEEYKNALMGDVDQIKTQSQEIGKKAAVAGGVILAGYLLKRMISGGNKKKAKKVKKANDKGSHKIPVTAQMDAYDSMVHEQEDEYTLSSERMPHAEHSKPKAKKKSKSFTESSVVKVISSQAAALLMMYISKKVSDHLNTISENDDIAAAPIVAPETETTEYIAPKENVI